MRLIASSVVLVCLFGSFYAEPTYAAANDSGDPQLNVLFIAVDDLRPELGCYGQSHIKSPNIDDLASRGLQFNRAYCQFALCNPSRSSLLTGRRPESIQIYNLDTFVRTHDPNIVTLPQMFMRNGYEARSIGKIFHVTNGNHEDDASWSTQAWHSPSDDAKKVTKTSIAQPNRASAQRAAAKKPAAKKPAVDPHADDRPFESRDVADDELIDGQIASKAIASLEELKGKPFFLAVGFHRPHMPWVAPAKYWQLYSSDSIDLPTNPAHPKGAPKFASNQASEFRRYMGVPKQGPIPYEMAREAIHGYYASVSYVDSQIGRVIDELDRLGLRDRTVIILWGDHGYHLGDYGTWNKRTNWESAARVPLIIEVPGQTNAGTASDALVELIDIYPTLAELCHLDPPASLEGRSFAPLVADPNQPWKDAAFTTMVKRTRLGSTFGRAMRTERYRFVEWQGNKSGQPVYELYDEQADPLERTNIASDPANAPLIAELAARLHENVDGSRPTEPAKTIAK